MTGYKPHVGDRVRVVLEGPVMRTGSVTFSLGTDDDGPMIPFESAYLVSVERVQDPLPITPGSIVEYYGTRYVRAEGEKEWHGAPWASVTNGDLGNNWCSDTDLTGAVVLFDAGQVQS